MERVIINDSSDLNNFFEDFVENTEKKGIIELPVPVLNINQWYDTNPSLYSLLLGLTDEEIRKVVYCATMVVSASQNENFEVGEILSETKLQEYNDLPPEEKEKVTLVYGAEAVKTLLLIRCSKEHLQELKAELRTSEQKHMAELDRLFDEYETPEAERIKAEMFEKFKNRFEENSNYDEMTEEEKGIKAIEYAIDKERQELNEVRCQLDAIMYYTKNSASLFINEINIFPIELRGIIKEVAKSSPYALYDLSELYGRIANRARRVKKLMEMNAPDVILVNEIRMLQEYVDTLIANGRRGIPYTGIRNDERCALTSLSDILLRSTKLA